MPAFGRHTLLALSPFVLLTAAASAQCDPSGIDTPYGTETFELVEWRGHYYDAGWFHLRSRPVEGGDWVDTGGGISGGGAYTLAEPMIEWNGLLVIGGAFFSAGGVNSPCIAGWDGKAFRPLGSGLNGEVLALTVWNGRLIAGGDFTAAGDGSPGLSHVAMLDPESTEWEPLGAGLGGFPAGYGTWRIGGLCVHDGELYATGRFTTSTGPALNGVARFDASVGQWRPLGSGISGMGSGNVGTAITSYNGELWLSGWFSQVGGVSAPWMAIWDGTSWRRGPNGPTRHCLDFLEFNGELYGVGPFSFTIGGTEWDIARFDGDTWHGFGNSDINWPNTLKITEDGRGLLTCGGFSRFNGVQTGGMVRLECPFDEPCPADLDGNGTVNGADLGLLIAGWGTAAADINGDGTTNGADVGLMVAAWGPCD